MLKQHSVLSTYFMSLHYPCLTSEFFYWRLNKTSEIDLVLVLVIKFLCPSRPCLILPHLPHDRLAKSRIKKPPPKRRSSKKYLSARERRAMGLNRLPREGLSCADLLPLHDLWKGYMADLVDFDKVKNSKGGDEQLQVGGGLSGNGNPR